LAGLALTLPSLKAQNVAITGSCQAAIEAYLTQHSYGTAPDRIATSSSTQLATAVAAVIRANTNSALVPPDFALSAILPYPYGTNGAEPIPEPERDADATLVTGTTVSVIIATGTTTVSAANLELRVAETADYVIDESGNAAADDLTTAGRESVLSAALTAVTDAYASASVTFRTTLIQADQTLGKTLLADTYLENLASNGFTTILEVALPGVVGNNPGFAPSAAQAFVTGLITTSSNTFAWPDENGQTGGQGATINQFTVSILGDVVSNIYVDNLVSNAIGSKIFANATNSVTGRESLVALGEALINTYTASNPTTTTNTSINGAFTAGLESSVTQGVDEEDQRIAFAESLTQQEVSSAIGIAAGAVYVDPYYAAGFTSGIFAKIYASNHTTLATDAPSLAQVTGEVIGADGNVLTQVADTFGTFIGAGELSATNAGTYALDLIHGAQNGVLPAAIGAGGKFVISTTTSVVDLASIADVLAKGVRTSFGSSISTNATTFGSDIGLIAKNIAEIVTNYSFTDSLDSNHSVPMAEFVAGTLADYIVALTGATSAETTDALNDIKTDVDAVVNTQVQADVNTAVTDAATTGNGFGGNADGDYGAIAVQETTVTNL
jgi:hypothetical protein